MIEELDIVVLTKDISEFELKRGDVGTVVHRYHDGKAFEVEFVTVDGRTVAVLTLDRLEIRQLGEREILHARELSPAD